MHCVVWYCPMVVGAQDLDAEPDVAGDLGRPARWNGSENHCAAVALYLAHYNFVRTHRTIRMPPALAAGVATHQWELGELLHMAEARASENATGA